MENRIGIDGQTVYFDSAEQAAAYVETPAQLVVTSPPYWNAKDYEHPDQIGFGENYSEYLSRLDAVWTACAEATADNAILLVNVRDMRKDKEFYPLSMDIREAMSEWTLIDQLVWYIPNALPQPNYYLDKLFDNKHESILVFAKSTDYDYVFNKPRVEQKYADDPREGKMNDEGRGLGNVFRMRAYRPPTIKQQNYHIAAFPEELVALLIHTFSEEGDYVLDPFLGSGTTLKVAKHMGRHGYGFELNTDYAEMITDRINEPFHPPDWKALDILSSVQPEQQPKRGENQSLSSFTE